jgi:hypothetical protein
MYFAVAVALVLIGCDQGKPARSKAEPTPEQKPAVAPPHGTIKGTATIAMSGPGRYHRPEESFTNTSGIDCTVKATDAWGHSHEVKTNPETGEFEMGVPAGRYDVSFEACAADSGCDGQAERIQHIEVTPDASTAVSWVCGLSAK